MRGVTSLEQFLDEHTEKRSDIAQLLEQNGIVLPPARSTALAAPAAQPSADTAEEQHLRWNGVRVSPEFERYAERVARGEELEPFRGHVLASGSAFPWNLGDSHTATTRLSEPPGVLALLASGGPANGAPVLPNALPAPANATLPPLVLDAALASPPAPWSTTQRAIIAALVLAIIALGKSVLSSDSETTAADDVAWPSAVRALRPSEPPARRESEETLVPRPESANVAPVVTQNVPALPNFGAAPVGKLASRSARTGATHAPAKAPVLASTNPDEASTLLRKASEAGTETAVAAAPSDLFVHDAPF
jgi:hypothetical protein